ncbi:MAG: M4 family metallopeptidase [Chloroflexi bacterium]|nr:M4 family metallopeptidase [Chloroflexota bacterium]
MRRSLVIAVMMTVLAIPAAGSSAARAAEGRSADRTILATIPGSQVAYHAETGRARFLVVGATRSLSWAKPDQTLISTSRAFLADIGPLFGIGRPDTDLELARQMTARDGRQMMRYQQLRAGVPVLGGELIVEMGARGEVRRASGEALPDDWPVATRASLSPSRAVSAALEVVARDHGIPIDRLRTGPPTLAIVDPRIIGGPGIPLPRLTWRVDVEADAPRLSQMVFIDAASGAVAHRSSRIHQALSRRICDFHDVRRKRFECVRDVARTEGQPPSGVAEVDRAYRNIADFDEFYRTTFGRDAIDDAGMPYVATVRYCKPNWCPMQNAFWDWEKEQVAFGNGWASADDLVAHEYQHGVLDHGSRLFYHYQSGAINESLSDIFGEMVDLSNARGDDRPAVRWLFGEDIIGYGVLRDLQHPPAYGDPDRVGSSLFRTGSADDGGVHTNSGVLNKTAALLTDGGSFNGYAIDPLGIGRTAAVFYEMMLHGLTSAGDFSDVSSALPHACDSLIGSAGIAANHCVEVRQAVLATELQLKPSGAAPEGAPVCRSGTVAEDAFFDDMEEPAAGNWSAISFGDSAIHWFYPQNTHPRSRWDATYASSGKRNLYGEDPKVVSDSAMVLTREVRVPQGGYLHLRHAFAFDHSGSTARDGGLIELSVDGGPWFDARAYFTHGGYNGTLARGNGNPHGGERAFTAHSYGYGASRIDLGAWAGNTIRVRFRTASDGRVRDYGWYIDDVRIYRCRPAG